MNNLCIFLFGNFHAQVGDQVIAGLETRKVQELFCYLLLNQQRFHTRETLTGLLWSDSSSAQSKKYLRQVLWQLQSVLHRYSTNHRQSVLLVDAGAVRLNPEADLWLDVAEFQKSFALAHKMDGRNINQQTAQALQSAVQLYRGDLMEGCYQDWCLYERERLQNIFLTMLDKLIEYCDAHQDYAAGMMYAERILRYDRASERAHRELMRLHYLAGDRTAALRQYERCVKALREELDVKPSGDTITVYQQIRSDQKLEPIPLAVDAYNTQEDTVSLLPQVLSNLKRLQVILSRLQHEVQRDIQSVEKTLNNLR